jgi:hypothetical protein
MALPNEVAAKIHAMMVDDDRFGYSWEERWGAFPERWNVLGREIEISVGDYDCSSSAITAWRLALQGTGYDGPLYDATYTGNMRAAFLATGLFEEWDTASTTAWDGDVYLNDAEHAAICQYDGGPDLLSEFCWGDNGAYGNVRGDQSGEEAAVHDYYWRPWDCTLHYVGGDLYGGQEAPQPEPQPEQPTSGWQGDLIGLGDTTGAGDDYAGEYGKPVLYVAIEGVGEYQAHPKGQPAENWLETVDHYDLSDTEYGMAGDGRPIDGLRILDPSVCYQVRTEDGEWHETMRGTSDSSPCGDDYAGEYGLAIDAIRIWRESGDQPRYNVFS